MMKSIAKSWRSRVLLGATLGLLLVIGSAGIGARAEDDDEELLDTKIFRGVLKSLGLRKDGEGIEYRERSPLVLPPGRGLPPPETGSIAARNPAWPVDPDVKRAKEAKANKPKYNKNPEEERPLLPGELNRPNP